MQILLTRGSATGTREGRLLEAFSFSLPLYHDSHVHGKALRRGMPFLGVGGTGERCRLPCSAGYYSRKNPDSGYTPKKRAFQAFGDSFDA